MFFSPLCIGRVVGGPQGRGRAKHVPGRGAAVIQAGQSSRPPRWQQCAAVVALVVSAQCVVRRVTTLGSAANSASRRFAASFRYVPSDNAPLPSRRGITKPAHGTRSPSECAVDVGRIAPLRRRRRSPRSLVAVVPSDASRASRPRRSRDRRALGVAGGNEKRHGSPACVRAYVRACANACLAPSAACLPGCLHACMNCPGAAATVVSLPLRGARARERRASCVYVCVSRGV